MADCGQILVLFEGVDKTGKTTEARALRQRFADDGVDAQYHHFSVPDGNPFKLYMDFLDNLDPTQAHFVDRLHWSNMVYQTVYRGRADSATAMTWEEWEAVDQRFNDLGGVVILRWDKPAEIAARIDAEDYAEARDADRLIAGFFDIAQRSSVPCYHVQFGDAVPAMFLTEAIVSRRAGL